MNENATGRNTLIVFAREPIPGKVKTRLIPALGDQGAADIYGQLLRIALDAAGGVPNVQRELWCDEHDRGVVCAALADQYCMKLKTQTGVDLGARMANALSDALRCSNKAVLIGSDSPEFETSYIERAFKALDKHDAVVGPAADGGYLLIGLRRMAASLFAEMPWGTAKVLEETRGRLRAGGLSWYELATLADVDEPDDLVSNPSLDCLT